jgi:hypothetical protein
MDSASSNQILADLINIISLLVFYPQKVKFVKLI